MSIPKSNHTEISQLSKYLVSAITNEVPISFGTVSQLDPTLIEHERHKLIVAKFKELYETPNKQPTVIDVACEVLKDIEGAWSTEDAQRFADQIEDGRAWGPVPDNIKIGRALNYFTLSRDADSLGLVSFKDLSPKGSPLATADNLETLCASLGFTPAVNLMNLNPSLLHDGKPINWSKAKVKSFLRSECLKAGVSVSAVKYHLDAISEGNKYHPVTDWLSDGSWDGIERVAKYIAALNPKSTELANIALRKWLIGAIACLYVPNFMSKLVPVLQGDQSAMKTAGIARIANLSNIVEGTFLEGAELDPDKKDSVMSVVRSWITELGELERTTKNGQGSLKAFITRSVDVFRPPYGEDDVSKPRQTALIATVNGSEFLRDDTGSSRFAVVELAGAVDIETINGLLGWRFSGGRLDLVNPERLRQFWLEVKSWFDAGETWHLTSDELNLFKQENDKHSFKNNWRSMLEDKFLGYDKTHRSWEWMRAAQVCAYSGISENNTRMVGKALKAMASDGLIESRDGRSRTVEYQLPTVMPCVVEK
ncbi:VapE domain-containing protein [Vibrio breoganii]|uniref:VapE domain-containing protein n=1 Tax=Vibrio breoganii TaxID=553239 RepID=UPI0002F7A20E|nr:VapE domain-containing protein [Vibrio breoganii]OED84645.1 virulence-associated E family protein [Vibrio breoganii ZF-55]